VKYYI